MQKKVIVAGHACLDITPVFLQTIKPEALGDILSPGRLVAMDGVDIHTGGVVSNTGLAMKRLGNDVSLVAKIGNDRFGEILRQIYKEENADQGLIIDEGGETSYSVVIAVPGFDRIFLHNSGCNDTFSFEDIQKMDLSEVCLVHFGYPPLMKKMYENQGKNLIQTMKYLKKYNVATSLDLAFVDETSLAGQADWKEILKNVLPYVDFFLPSIEEVCYMLEPERYVEWKKRSTKQDIVNVLDVEQDVLPLARKCVTLGAKVVLLKCGAPGFFYKTGEKKQMENLAAILKMDVSQWTDQEGFEKSYIPDRILSGTGAGDTTIAAFLSAVLKQYPFKMCMHLAAAEGASCITEYDALSGILSLEELENKINQGWEKKEN